MRIWLLRSLLLLLLTLGAAFISVVVYDHTVGQENMLRFRTTQRSEVLENVGRLLLEWRRNGAAETLDKYLDEQQEQGRAYTLFDGEGNVLAGAPPDQKLLDLTNQALKTHGYAYIDGKRDFFDPALRQPPMESFVFRGRDNARYTLALSHSPAMMPAPGKPRPYVFIVLGACVALLLHCAFVRLFAGYARELRAAMRLLAQGDFGVRVDPSMERRKDIFAKLAKDFNATVTSLAGKQAEHRYVITDLTHDMRSSLTRMVLAMELARNTSPDKAAQLLSRIKADSDKLNSISEQLMHHVRQQWNDSQRTPLQLVELLRPLIRELNSHARGQNKRVLFYNRENCRILGNESQIASMVQNIATNALRHSPAGGEVCIFLERDAKNEAARIIVQDEGPGLPQEMLREVFEPFRQGENHGESGLGLAIAKLVSERHGGSITLSNRPNAGLQATILLPLMQSGDVQRSRSEATDAEAHTRPDAQSPAEQH